MISELCFTAWIYIFISIFAPSSPQEIEDEQHCDWAPARWIAPKEGNVRQTAQYPWLGVLQVEWEQEGAKKVALTGAVLIKHDVALSAAEDVDKIPKSIFKKRTKAMFIASQSQPWTCGVLDFDLEPSYKDSKSASLALVRLDITDTYPEQLQPICLPMKETVERGQMFAFGYTDENNSLEKVVYKMKYVDEPNCTEYYNSQQIFFNSLPEHYFCASVNNSKDYCVWESGMVMASKSTHWELIGVSVRGPGCAAPTRFISIVPLLPWIHQRRQPSSLN